MDLFTQAEKLLRFDELEVGSEYVLVEGTNKIYDESDTTIGWVKKNTKLKVVSKTTWKVYFDNGGYTSIYMVNNERVKLLVKL